MELTKQQLKQLLPKNPYIDQWHNALSQLLPDYQINTPQLGQQHITSSLMVCSTYTGIQKRVAKHMTLGHLGMIPV